MKPILITTLFFLTSLIQAAEPESSGLGTVRVTGDRVSLRAAPDLNAVLIDRAMSGDELELKDDSNPEWAGVIPPESSDLWVNREFVADNTVVPEKLNVRSGPSLSHTVVGILSEGTRLTVRGEIADWLRIAPTPDCTVWISRRYADVTLSEPVVPVEPAEADVAIEVTQEKEPEILEPDVYQVIAAAGSLKEEARQSLRPDPDRKQGLEGSYSGVLLPFEGLLYKLTGPEPANTVRCYVRGNLQQMEAFSQLPVRLTGKLYWAEGFRLPILVPEKIQVLESIPFSQD